MAEWVRNGHECSACGFCLPYSAECYEWLEQGDSGYVVKALDRDNKVKIEVIADKDPRLMVRYLGYFNDGWLTLWSVGMQIKYCPMCGRRLTNG